MPLIRLWICGFIMASLAACTVGERYVVPADTWARVRAMTPDQRAHTVALVHRAKQGMQANVIASTLVAAEAAPRADGDFVVPTRMSSRKLVLGSTLVWIGTPLSIAGLAMVIWGTDPVRYAGIALAGAAEPIMIAGTVLWVQAANSHPQEVDRIGDLQYLPAPGAPAGLSR